MAQQDELDESLAQEFASLQQSRNEPSPTTRQKLGSFTVACLILNRTIGSGIFVAPRLVLLGTGSVAISVILWAVGGLIMLAGLVVWNEMGLTLPQRVVPGGRSMPVPRSGGEKNYLEYLLQRPRFLATCLYGIAFLVLGNLSGNAVAFGTYVLEAAGRPDAPRSWNIAIAIAATTAACFIHVFSRRGGILLSNFFAVLKVVILLAISVIGLAVAGGAKIGVAKSEVQALNPSHSFATHTTDASSFTFSLFYVLYTYSGFEQPFYVLGECKHPRKTYPRTTLLTMGLTIVLFVLVNIAYVCVVPTDAAFLESGNDMANLFFTRVFGPELAPRVVSAVISLCIAGNIIVMTFTAARVKQEIAKEGILPFSLFFAAGCTTPDAWLRARFSRSRHWLASAQRPDSVRAADELLHPERTPAGALLLHWIMSVLMIGVTASLSAGTAYSVLVFLYTYVMVALVGFCVSVGLLSLYFRPGLRWQKPDGPHGFRPWGGPAAAMLYAAATLFTLVAVFLRPADDSPFGYAGTHIQWYIQPAIGLSAPLWGLVWWVGLHLLMRMRGLELVVTRVPHIALESDAAPDAEWIQRSELITRVWLSRRYAYTMRDSTSMAEEPFYPKAPVYSSREVAGV